MIVTICLVLLTLATMPMWGPILLIGVVFFAKLSLALICWPFELVDHWKRRRAYARGRRR